MAGLTRIGHAAAGAPQPRAIAANGLLKLRLEQMRAFGLAQTIAVSSPAKPSSCVEWRVGGS